jgi:toxin ParE1/3/4
MKRTVIAFDVDSENVSIIGIFYVGQDYETILQDDSEDGSAH